MSNSKRVFSTMEPALKETFSNDVYSNHFNYLRRLGQWNSESDDPRKRNLQQAYRFFACFYGMILSISAMISLHQSRSDIKKVVFNICTTTLICGIWIKNLHVQSYSRRVNQLRVNLFMDGWRQKGNMEDVEIREKHTKILIFLKRTFYVAAYSLLPLWLITSLTTLVWGPRQLPFSVWVPANLDDDFQFFCAFFYHVIGSVFVVAQAVHADMATFSLLLQIISQYNILEKDISKIDCIFVGKMMGNERKNRILVKHRIKEEFRTCVERQLVLMGYLKELETVYNKPMVVQFLCGLLLSVANGLELLLVSSNFSRKLSYQIGYALIVLGDVLMYCHLSTLLIIQKEKVAWSLYNLAWYDMDAELRKYLRLIIMGAQKPQPLTAGKIFDVHLETFLGVLKNIYSWFALFRQLIASK